MFPDLLPLEYSDSQLFILKGIRIPNRLHASIDPKTFMRERLPSSLPFSLNKLGHLKSSLKIRYQTFSEL